MRDALRWRKIYPRAVKAEKDFAMLQPGDRILVAVSGGADSLVLLDVLAYQHKKIGKTLGLEVVPAHVPGTYRGKPTTDAGRLGRLCRELGFELRLSGAGLSDGVFSDCFRCSRARRRLLFDLAEEHRCGKIALGHNADDLVETFLLNAFYSGRLAAMSPRQPVLRGKLCFIRPLAYAWKDDIDLYARQRFGRLPGFKCPGSGNSRRLAVRRLLARLSRGNPHLRGNLLKAVCNPRLEYLPVPSRRL